jgi:hypothetical protein
MAISIIQFEEKQEGKMEYNKLIEKGKLPGNNFRA